MSGAWLNFARHGEPAHDALPEWSAYDRSDRAVLDLDVSPRIVSDPGGSEREFWAP